MPRTGPRKREHPGDQHKGGPVKRRPEGQVVHDPMKRLNLDVMGLLLRYLPSADLVRCERVSRAWQQTITGWVASVGLRLRFQSSWHQNKEIPTSESVLYDAFKLQAGQSHRLQYGKPASIRRLKDVHRLVVAGDYVAWISKPDRRCQLPHRLHWQYTGSDGSHQVRDILASRLLRVGGYPAHVSGMALNHDGILLVQLKAVPRRQGQYLFQRDVVYSPQENKTLWRSKQKSSPSHSGHIEVPLLVGSNRVYCAVQDGPGDSFKLAAYNFRSGAQLYLSDTGIWYGFDGGADISFANQFTPSTTQGPRLVNLTGGMEMLLHASPAKLGRRTRWDLSVINGSNGHLIHTINFPEASFDSFVADPFSNRIDLVSEITSFDRVLYNHHWPLVIYRLILLRRFEYQDNNNSFTTLSTDALFAPRDASPRPNYHRPSPLTVHPFHMVALASSLHMMHDFGHSDGQWSLVSRSIVSTDDRDLRAAATAVIKDRFRDDAPVIDQCFVFGDGNLVTLPPNRSRKRNGRTGLALPGSHNDWQAQFVDAGRVLLIDGDTRYLLDFS